MLEPDDLTNSAEIIEVYSTAMSYRPTILTAADLQHMKFPEPRFAVPDVLPEGLTILAGAPKVGKSWMALGLAIAVASGTNYLTTTPCVSGDVLYLALEDNPARLQSRLNKLITDGSAWPKSLEVATEWQSVDRGGLQDIENWITRAKNPRLIVIDVLTYIRPSKPDGRNQYQADFLFLSQLQTLASSRNVGILVVHHIRKAVSEADPFERVSGTFGLTGAADTILILDRDGQGVSLYGRGRDIAEFHKAVRLNQETLHWEALGEPSDVYRSPERNRIINFLSAQPSGCRPEDIAIGLGAKRNNIEQLLSKMIRDGCVVKRERGVYTLPDNLIAPYDP